MKASNNEYPSVLFIESAAPSNPASGDQRLYVGTDHVLRLINSSGTISTLPVNPMTAAGDLIIGGASGAPARLAITVPAANILNVPGVVNGETTWSVKSIHDGTAPTTSALADAAAAGTALTAAHRDHKHGRETYPTYHGCKAYDTAAQAINTTTANLTFSLEEFDTDAFHDPVTNNSRMTIPTGMTGYYLLQAGANTSAGNTQWMGFYLNGTTFIRSLAPGGTTGQAQYAQVQAIYKFTAADYVEVRFSTSATTNVGGGGTDGQKWFAITLLGI